MLRRIYRCRNKQPKIPQFRAISFQIKVFNWLIILMKTYWHTRSFTLIIIIVAVIISLCFIIRRFIVIKYSSILISSASIALIQHHNHRNLRFELVFFLFIFFLTWFQCRILVHFFK
jgi:hypothetical protein